MNIFLLGKPGSGKGTVSKELEKLNFVHLSTGDLLRNEIAKGTELGNELKELLKGGNFATDEVVFELVNKFIEENKDKNIIFDGFPRNLPQMEKCLELGIIFDKIFLLDVEDEVLVDRVINRRVHLPSGRIYHEKFRKEKVKGFDDVTGEPLTHREDDREDVLQERLRIYNELTSPIIEFLHNKNFIVHKLDANEKTSETMNKIITEINKNNKKHKM